MDILIGVSLLFLFLANIITTVWSAKLNSKTRNTRTTVIYGLYKELKRMNDIRENEASEN